jgi:hypothetical protein
VAELADIIAEFGASAKGKLANTAVTGAPEDQLRAPLETLVLRLAELAGHHQNAVKLVGEMTLAHLSSRPDYAVTVQNALAGFIEVKAPGKGFDPRRFTDEHDKKQWQKLKTLPNIIYTDGNGFSYRKKDRRRPVIGDRRPPSPLSAIQPDHWLAEYTSDLLDLLHVLGRLVALEPAQARALDDILGATLLDDDQLRAAGALGAIMTPQ